MVLLDLTSVNAQIEKIVFHICGSHRLSDMQIGNALSQHLTNTLPIMLYQQQFANNDLPITTCQNLLALYRSNFFFHGLILSHGWHHCRNQERLIGRNAQYRATFLLLTRSKLYQIDRYWRRHFGATYAQNW